MQHRFRIVTVTYNSAAVIGDFLASVPPGVDVVVVDNASTDATCEIVAKSDVQLIRMPRNAGFGTGCNAGAQGNEKEFVFFVNPDAKLTPDCCSILLAAADAHLEAVCFNPGILNEKGEIRLNRRSALLARGDWTPSSYGGPDNEISAEVKILSGAGMFCRQAAFDVIGGFDPIIFLYHEDDDLCFRLRLAGGRLRLEHAAKLHHLGGKSSGSSVAGAAQKAHFIAQSRLYVEYKHGLSVPKLRGFARALIKLLSPLNLVSARKRAQAVGYLKGILAFDLDEYRKNAALTASPNGAVQG